MLSAKTLNAFAFLQDDFASTLNLIWSLNKMALKGVTMDILYPTMFIPITSEVNIEKGMVLKEIATGRLFEVGSRLNNREDVLGDDPWEITEIAPGNHDRTSLALGYEALTRKFFAEVDD